MRKIIKEIRNEIFNLAKQAKTLDIMHWYIALDNCFENDELQLDEIGNMKWRIQVLKMKNEPVDKLVDLITPVLRSSELQEVI